MKELELDRKFGLAMANKDTDPAASRAMLLELSEAGGRIAGTALRELCRRHSLGDSLPKDGPQALAYLMESVAHGDALSQLLLAREYGMDELDRSISRSAQLVPEDRGEAIRWYRAAAQTNQSARLELAAFLRGGRQAAAIPANELAEIEACYEKEGKFATLALMHCEDRETDACTPQDVEQARKWLLRGSEAGCECCDAQLKEWGRLEARGGLAASEHPVPTCASATEQGEKSRDGAGLLTTVLTGVVAIAFWSFIGGALLAVVVGIQAVVFPVLTAVAFLAFVIKMLRR